MAQTSTNIDEYISAFPPDTQKVLQAIRQVIRSVAPNATETISYQIPAFKLTSGYMYFAGWKDHVAVYPLPHHNEALHAKIAPYIAGKGTAKFPLSQPIPYDLIKQIAEQLVTEGG